MRRIAICLALIFPAAFSSAADPVSAPVKVTAVEGITEYRLANGLKVLLFPDVSRPTVTVNLTVLVGSRHEGYGETGMAHLLEHMVFKGTPTHKDIPKALRDHGAHFNGTTSYDRTNYYETMPASAENLEFALRLEADRLVNSLIRRDDLLSEMTVVRNEFEQGENDAESILSQRMIATAFEWHNYGKSTIGNRSDIERVPIENLQAFYKKHYQPDNCVLIVAGKFKETQAVDLIRQYFSAIPRPTRKLDHTYTEEPAQDGERQVTLRRVGSNAAVGAVHHIVAGAHPDYPACEVLEFALAGQPAGRLYKALVEAKLATRVHSEILDGHDPGFLQFSAVSDAGNVDAARGALVRTLDGLAKSPITDEEVERAKRHLLRQREQLMTEPTRVATALSDWAAKGDWRLFFLHRDRLEKVSEADVNRVAKQYLHKNNRTVGMFIPTKQVERVEVTAAPPIGEMLKDYRGRTAVVAGEDFDPTPVNLDARIKLMDLGGMKAALLPRKTRGEQVTLQVTVRYGNEESLRGKSTAASMINSMLMRGAKGRTRQQIQDDLDKLGARLTPVNSGVGVLSYLLTAKQPTLKQAVEILGDVLRNPTFPSKEFETLRHEARESQEKGRTEPQMIAMRTLQRKLSPYPAEDVRYVPSFDEELQRLNAVTLEQVKKIYTEQVSGTHGELAAVGDFDADSLAKQWKDIVSGWNAKTAYRRIPRPAPDDVRGEKITIVTPDKANAMHLAGLAFPVSDADSDYAPLELGNFILGGGIISNRLGVRLRQKDGLSYGVMSNYTASSRDPASNFLVMAICNPANIDKVEAAISEELNRFLSDGVSLTELDDAKKALLKQYGVDRSNDRRLVQTMATNASIGRKFAYYAELEKKIQALTPGQILTAFHKHIVPSKLVMIRAGDFKN